MAAYRWKADINENVRPEFKEIYELLHQGFVDEKLVVPGSMLHDIESSLAEKCLCAAAYRIAVIDHQYFDVFIHLA